MTIEEGRGPVHRLIHVLPHLSENCDLILISLGVLDEVCQAVAMRTCKQIYKIEFGFSGWFVKNLHKVKEQILHLISLEQPDIVILSWELWDLMYALALPLFESKMPFAAIIHCTPFIGVPPKYSGKFFLDVLLRIIEEESWNVAKYMFVRTWSIKKVMRHINLISISETTTHYMKIYYKDIALFEALPGCAVDLGKISRVPEDPKTYDFVFMSKLYKSKGIYDLLHILDKIKQHKNHVSLLVLGSFSSLAGQKRFYKLVEKLELTENVYLSGWIQGTQKYRLLKRGRIFLYPSSADTFSISLLEALACGLPAICYDVPFTRKIYNNTSAVKKIDFQDYESFASMAISLLNSETYRVLADSAIIFARQYSSWKEVAESELAIYREILGGP